MDKNYRQMLLSIDHCLQEGLDMPCLVLIYSTIDSISWFAYGEKEPSTKNRFVQWVEKYLLPQLAKRNNISFSSIDLYAARCSILHTLSCESSLSEKGKAKPLLYFGGGGEDEFPKLPDRINFDTKYSIIHIDALAYSLEEAINDFILMQKRMLNLQVGLPQQIKKGT